MSASLDGLSDLVLYKSKNRNFEKITDDYFDDLDALYTTISGSKGILFASNRKNQSIESVRLDTILPLDKFDIFFLPDGSKELKRLTTTSWINERFPFPAGDGKLVFTGDASGMINSYILDLKSNQTYAISDLDRNLIRHHAVAGSGVYISTYYKDGMYKFFKEKTDFLSSVVPHTTQSAVSGTDSQKAFIPFVDPNDSKQIQIPDQYKFQTKYADPPELEPIKIKQVDAETSGNNFRLSINNPSEIKQVEPFNNNRAIAANNKFGLSNITTKLDNDILFEGLESYTGDRQQLLTTPMGLLLKANIRDLFEDFNIEGGVRIPTSFNGSEYFLIDKKFALYRKSNTYNSDPDVNQSFLSRSKKTALLGMYQMRYPFDIYRSVRATSTLRLDRFLALSTETNSFEAPAASEKRISLRVEYIYDNTYDAALNIKNGTRYKFYSEIINQFDMQVIDGFKFDASKGFTALFGFDARHYIPLLGKSVLALRAAGATSLGSQKMLYFLGGVENWILPKFDNSVPIRSMLFTFVASTIISETVLPFYSPILNCAYHLCSTSLEKIKELHFSKTYRLPVFLMPVWHGMALLHSVQKILSTGCNFQVRLSSHWILSISEIHW
jgi:hypothetical protein